MRVLRWGKVRDGEVVRKERKRIEGTDKRDNVTAKIHSHRW